ncbi:MAG: hypothetical protein ACLFV7_08160 [Phycisphaerae bacterium]
MWLEYLIVFLLILVSMAVLGWVFVRKGKGGCSCGGGSGCGLQDTCPGAPQEPAERKNSR